MILLDANLLLYAYNSDSAEHERARLCLEQLFNGQQLVGLPWTSVWAFLRIATHRQIFRAPYNAEEVCEIVAGWLQCPNVRLIGPGERHWVHLHRLMSSGQVQGPLAMDAVLAAIAQEHGGEIWTSDRDFARFPDVRCHDPLAERKGS